MLILEAVMVMNNSHPVSHSVVGSNSVSHSNPWCAKCTALFQAWQYLPCRSAFLLLHDLLLSAKLFKSDAKGSLSSVSIKDSRDKSKSKQKQRTLAPIISHQSGWAWFPSQSRAPDLTLTHLWESAVSLALRKVTLKISRSPIRWDFNKILTSAIKKKRF